MIQWNDLATFVLGTLFGVVTTVAIFRATVLIHERRIKSVEDELERLCGFVDRIADELGEQGVIFIRRESDRG